MTNLLVPTDFSTASLQLAEQSVKVLNREVNVILFHAFDMPFYYSDLIRPTSQPWQKLLNDDLRTACRQLKERYPLFIRSIGCRFMQGSSAALFRNWAEANEIDIIACPAGYMYTRVHELSLDPIPLFKKSRLTLLNDFTTSRAFTEHSAGTATGNLSIAG